MGKNGYAVIQSGYAIFGVGATKQEAIDDANNWTEDPIDDDLPSYGNHGDMILVRASEKLVEYVKNHGTPNSWGDFSDGICLLEEEEE